jgi:hypothetical protein
VSIRSEEASESRERERWIDVGVLVAETMYAMMDEHCVNAKRTER